MKERKLIGKFDILISAAVILLLAALSLPLYFAKGDVTAQIYYDGNLVEEINLTRSSEKRDIITGENNACIIRADKNEIYFLESDCPDKICIKSGRLSKSGQFASCVPEKVTVILKGNKNGDAPDAITY